MSLAAPHIGFVIAAYAVTIVVLAGLIGAVVGNDRAKARRLADLEARGAPRRRRAAAPAREGEH